MKILRSIFRFFRPKVNIAPFINSIIENSTIQAIDVGAAAGIPPHWNKLLGSAKFYLFEPHPDSRKQLEDIYKTEISNGSVKLFSSALSMNGGIKTLYQTNIPTGSSLLPINDIPANIEYVPKSYFFPVKELKLETETLSNVLNRENVSNFDIIKLDVQGTELEILKGIDPKRLQACLGIEVEIALFKIYKGQPNFGDYELFFQQNDFDIFDVRVSRAMKPFDNDPGHYYKIFGVYPGSPFISARTGEFDVIYFKKADILIARNDLESLKKLIALYCVYNFFIEAYALTEKLKSIGLLNSEDSNSIKDTIKEWYKKTYYTCLHSDKKPFRFVRKVNMYMSLIGSEKTWARYMWVNPPDN